MPVDRPDPSRDTGGRARRASRLGHALGAEDDLPLDPDLEDGTALAGPTTPRSPARPRARAAPSMLAAVFAGGFVGSLARDAVERAWAAPTGHFPTATFAVNTSGAFLLGVLLTILVERVPNRSRWLGPRPAVTAHLRVLVGAGLLGGWTTYSTMVVEAAGLARAAHLPLAAGYLALSLVCGLIATVLGIALGRSRARDASGRRGEVTVRTTGRGPSKRARGR